VPLSDDALYVHPEQTWLRLGRLLLAAAMDVEESVEIRVNGEAKRVACRITVAQMLTALGLDPAKVAVERNREIVARSFLGQVVVEDGDEFEIVHFVGGG